MKLRGGEFSTGTMGNFQPESTIPMISAACHQVIFFAKARKITSCIFIVRSRAAIG